MEFSEEAFAESLVCQDPRKARMAQTQKWSENCEGGQVMLI